MSNDANTTERQSDVAIAVSESVIRSTPVQNMSHSVSSVTPAARNALVYVAGYVAHRIRSSHSCSCSDCLRKPGSLDDSGLAFIQLKAISAGDFGKLSIPSDGLVSYLYTVENHFVSVLQKFVHE